MFRWGIIFLVIALISRCTGLWWVSRYRSRCGENRVYRRYHPVPGQPVYGPQTSIASDTDNLQSQSSDWLLSFMRRFQVRRTALSGLQNRKPNGLH